MGVAVDRASTSNVSEPGAGRRLAVAGGVGASATWPVASRWRVGLVGALWAALPAADFTFTVDAGKQPMLRWPAVSGFAALRVEGALLP